MGPVAHIDEYAGRTVRVQAVNLNMGYWPPPLIGLYCLIPEYILGMDVLKG